MRLYSKYILKSLSVLLLLFVVGCMGDNTKVRLEGEFSHLDQGEFLLYSSDGVIEGIDSIHLREGRFQMEIPIQKPGTLHILYPNYSQLTLFVQGGEDLRIKGDARMLNEVKVKGSKENELYTSFRTAILGKSDREAQAFAYAHALANPQTIMSRYLLQTYFLQRNDADPTLVHQLFDSLMSATPEDVTLGQLAMQVQSYRRLEVGKTLPHFSLKVRPTDYTQGKADSIVSDTTLQGKYLLMFFWASWQSDSRSSLYYARQHRIRSGMKNQAMLSYSLDTDEADLRDIEKRDTITYISYCDHQAFSSPLVEKWGITNLPFYLFVSPKGEILASGKDWKSDIEPTLKKLVWNE